MRCTRRQVLAASASLVAVALIGEYSFSEERDAIYLAEIKKAMSTVVQKAAAGAVKQGWLKSSEDTAVVLTSLVSIKTAEKSLGGKYLVKKGESDLRDDGISRNVKTLYATNGVDFLYLDVHTIDGVVGLYGRVRTPAEKIQAERLAWQAVGVNRMVSDLKVVP